jgi:hypothetical protein
MKCLLLFVLWLGTSASLAADFNPFDGPQPIAVLIESNPWAMVIGADTPRIAIYENGEVIFAKKINNTLAYHRIAFDEAGFAVLRQQMQSVMALKTLKVNYDIANMTSQPEAMFYLRNGAHDATTAVYGLTCAGQKYPVWTTLPGHAKPEEPPNELLQFHKRLCEFDAPNSEPWTPKYVEAMLWGYAYAPDPSIQWPKEWPSLNSDRALKRNEAYSIFLDGVLLPKLEQFLATRKEKGAIELDGKKWAVAYRHTFPGEPTWHAAFTKSEKK